MKTPAFWSEPNFLSRLLKPLGTVYAFATRLRIGLGRPCKIGRPVVCIGNLTAGGTGKTPVAVAVAGLLQQAGKNPFFVSRGYGGTLKNIMVDKEKHTASEVGDEPLLLARRAPVIVNPDRVAGAQKALRSGAEVIVMDDGFQNPGLYKDLSFLVFDGGFGIGNGLSVPAGPLRENFAAGLKRAHAAIILGEDKHNLSAKIAGIPIFRGSVVPVRPEVSNTDAVAFAGIGRPEKFYQSLRDLDMAPVETYDFPDHHRYTPAELEKLIARGKELNADIFTTSKDYVKIPLSLQKHFKVLQIDIAWEDEAMLSGFILNKISRRG